jgi:hypothetical protein
MTKSEPPAVRWLLLIHQIPPKPDYFRVKVRRRLQRLGAVALKNSVYVLPASEETLEDFQWLAREIVDDGGEATVCESAFVEGMTDDAMRQLFRDASDQGYRAIAHDARTVAGSDSPPPAELARLKQRLTEAQRIDFFDAPARRDADDAMTEVERAFRPAQPGPESTGEPTQLEKGRTWVTRRGVHVDRIASVWLIRRFIDPEARFLFVDPKQYRPRADQVRFDMFDAEYTHEGDRCTFETLLLRFGLRDRALRAIAEIVHDIDCKDEKFGREEVAGLASLIAGIARAHEDDLVRIDRGRAVFDDLYASFEPRRRRE